MKKKKTYLILLLVLITIYLVSTFFLARGIEKGIKQFAAQIGISLDFKINRFGLNGIKISNIKIGDGEIKVDQIILSYSVTKFELNKFTLDGLQLKLVKQDGKLGLKGFSSSKSSSNSKFIIPPIPFKTVEIKNVLISVEDQIAVPLDFVWKQGAFQLTSEINFLNNGKIKLKVLGSTLSNFGSLDVKIEKLSVLTDKLRQLDATVTNLQPGQISIKPDGFNAQIDLSSKLTYDQQIILTLPYIAISYLDQKFKINLQRGESKIAERFTINDISAQIAGDEKELEVHLKAPSITSSDNLFIPLAMSAKLSKQQQKAQFDFYLADTRKNLEFKVHGKYDLEDNSGKLKVNLKPLFFKYKGLQPEHLLPVLSKYFKSSEGVFKLQGIVDINDKKISPMITVSLKKFSSLIKEKELTNLDFTATMIDMFSTFPREVISFKQFKIDPAIEKLKLTWGLKGAKTLQVDQLYLQTLDGQVKSSKTLVDLNKKSATDFDIYLKSLSLNKVLKLALKDDASGSGTISGKIPIKWKDGVAIIKNGIIYTESPGVIKYNSKKTAGMAKDKSVNLLLRYLQNFNYSYVKVTLNSNTSWDLFLTFEIFGHNPKVLQKKPLKFKMTLNVNLFKMLKSGMGSFQLPQKIEKLFEKQ